MKEANKEIRAEIDKEGLTYWQVAEQIGIHATTFTVWLRTPLDEIKSKKVSKAIEELTNAIVEG